MSFKNKNLIKDSPFFTHFGTLPFLTEAQRAAIKDVQEMVLNILGMPLFNNNVSLNKEQVSLAEQIISRNSKNEFRNLRLHSHLLAHLTLFKLNLRQSVMKNKLKQLLNEHSSFIISLLEGVIIGLDSIKYFTRYNKSVKMNEITVIYIDIDQKTRKKLDRLSDFLLRCLLKEDLLVPEELKAMNVLYDHSLNMYRSETLHISLFRATGVFEDQGFLEAMAQIQAKFKMLQFQPRLLDISTMQEYDKDHFYLPFHRLFLKKNEQSYPSDISKQL